MPRYRSRLDRKELFKQVSEFTVPIMRERAVSVIQEEVDKANDSLIRKFLEHKISEEIQAGPNAENSSGTLGGYGNLFSFIGFNRSEEPIRFVAGLLADSIKVKNVIVRRQKMLVYFSISLPNKEKIFDQTPLPWVEAGRSWIQAIESGIAGFGEYLYDEEFADNELSNSGAGLQAKNKIRGGRYTAQKYLSDIINEIAKELIARIRSRV